MKLYMPSYCKNFKCIADKCSDNCCIGWEIDIDSDTLAFYGSIPGEFGKKLKENISNDGTAHFILSEAERCPFLNKSNLCEIITNLGEEHLCQICCDHPRYFNWYEDFMEGGIGLCCEEGARLIIECDAFETYTTERFDAPGEKYDKDTMDFLKAARQKLIALFSDENITICDAVFKSLQYAKGLETELYTTDDAQITSDVDEVCTELFTLLMSLEAISESWCELSKKLFEKRFELGDSLIHFSSNGLISQHLKNIAVYFIWRYFLPSIYTGEVYGSIFLMCVSILGIAAAMKLHIISHGELTKETVIKIAKDFSKQIEYSEDNLSLIFDAAYENEKLSLLNILQLL